VGRTVEPSNHAWGPATLSTMLHPAPTEAELPTVPPAYRCLGPGGRAAVKRSGRRRLGKEAFYRKYFGAVWRTALRLLRSRTEAEDVVQDSFAIALDEVGKLRDPSALRVWLLRITVHQVHRRFRKRRLRRWLGPRPRARPSQSRQARSSRNQRGGRRRARAARPRIACLPESERTAWILRHVEGYELREVAVACNCSLATAKRRLGAAAAEVAKSVDFAEDGHG